jgi:sugar/nucleoside kinase (ribokinase family)
MQTYLGAAAEFEPADVDETVVSRAAITYLEGYLWDRPPAKEAFLKATRIAHQAGSRVALTLSDPLCVERHRADFLDLIDGHVDILLANEAEIVSLYQTQSFEEAAERVAGHCEIAALTRSDKGSVILMGGRRYDVDIERVGAVVDTTGAGDLYAAGFLFGLTRNLDAEACGRMAAIAAAEVISHFGARPETSLADLVKSRLR